jgi:hypothetical protein
MMPEMPTAITPLQWLLDAARTRLLGRRASWTVGGVQVSFEVEDIDLAADPMFVGAGQADELRVAAKDIVWDTRSFPTAHVTFRNLHTRPGKQPALVAAPIDVQVRVTSQDVAERIRARIPWLEVEITDNAELRARLRRRADWGWVVVALTPHLDGLAANLRTLTLRGRTWTLPSRLRPIVIPLSMPSDARLTEVVPMPESLELHIRLDERRIDLKNAMSFLSGAKRSSAPE